MHSSSDLKLCSASGGLLSYPSEVHLKLRETLEERGIKGSGECGPRALALDSEDLGSSPQVSTG